jgi:transcriptional antiterminator NusG
MCYVIYTGVGREKTVQLLIARVVPRDLYTRCFFTYRHMCKKIGGKWADIYEWLIPGYLFVITDRINDFYQALRTLPRYGAYARLLGRDGRLVSPSEISYTFEPLAEEEERWLRSLIGDRWFDAPSGDDFSDAPLTAGSTDAEEEEQEGPVPRNAVVELSAIGFDENDRVRILSGPLMTFSGRVRKLDLHRRIAIVEVDFMGKPQLLHLGFEILIRE